jgi:hypothetical protein
MAFTTPGIIFGMNLSIQSKHTTVEKNIARAVYASSASKAIDNGIGRGSGGHNASF